LHRLRSIAVYLALVALVMRALVPVGWMPAHAASSSTLVPCPMMDGMHGAATPQQNEEPQHPAKHQLPDSHEGSICPFATSAQPVRMIEPHRIEINPPCFASFAAAASGLWASWDHVPRAPPDIA
jgi:hypothetical protein